VELTKERKANPPDPAWVPFEYGNPGSYRNGLATLPRAIAAELGAPHGQPVGAGSRVRLGWKLVKVEAAKGGGFEAVYETPRGKEKVRARNRKGAATHHHRRYY
jgi:oxygen-dependent protoporphyrinogen oxidase